VAEESGGLRIEVARRYRKVEQKNVSNGERLLKIS
jgi:hypothetical protein